MFADSSCCFCSLQSSTPFVGRGAGPHLSAQVPRIVRWFPATARLSCCTDHGRQSLYFTAGSPFISNLSLPMGVWTLI